MTPQAAWGLNQETEPRALPVMTQGSERGGRSSVHGLWGSIAQVGLSVGKVMAKRSSCE